MITFILEENDTKAAAVENGAELRVWPVGSKNSMVRYIQTTGVEKFDLNATDLGKALLKKIQRAAIKATNPTPKAEPVQAEHPDVAQAEPAPVPTTEATPAPTAGNVVEQTFVVDSGDSVTVVHPAQ